MARPNNYKNNVFEYINFVSVISVQTGNHKTIFFLIFLEAGNCANVNYFFAFADL